MLELSIDFESRSTVDLRATGVYPYAAHPLTSILCMAWAFGDEEVALWTPKEPLPDRIIQHIADLGKIRAWNAQFERVMWRSIVAGRMDYIDPNPDQFIDTAAEAAAMALPRSLDYASEVLHVAHKKDNEGYNQMLRMAKPRKPRKGEDPNGLYWFEDEDRLQRLYEYCKQDVRTERAIKNALHRLRASETETYLLDQVINDRGAPIDMQLVRAAQHIADIGRERSDAQLVELTGGAALGMTKRDDIVEWLKDQGIETESIAKAKVAEMLEGELPERAREVLQLRADTGKSSLAKLEAFVDVAGDDGRARGLHLYHAASTGRWGGKLIQTQNLPRPTIEEPESFVDDVLAGNYDLMALIEHPLLIVSSMLRSMIAAPDGFDLIAADFSAIEARVLNWIAGQEDVLGYFRAMDAGDKSRHPYKMMAVKMGRGASSADIIKGSTDYQAGKAAELGCGFQMGAAKFVRAAWEVYQVRVTDDEAVTAVKAYRDSHQHVVDLWYDVERAVKQAIATPGVPFTFGSPAAKLKAIVAGSYLYLVLPSKRTLVYAAPSVMDAETSWGAIKPTIHFWGIDPSPYGGRKWAQLRTYGGHLIENIVQAIARDLLTESMKRLELRGYPIVMHVHDEAVAEIPHDFGSVKEMEAIMAETPEWATGCPVAAEGWRGKRYRK